VWGVKGLGERPSERLPAAAALPGSGLADIDRLRRLAASINSTQHNAMTAHSTQHNAMTAHSTQHNAMTKKPSETCTARQQHRSHDGSDKYNAPCA
jgi:hypothetical protein